MQVHLWWPACASRCFRLRRHNLKKDLAVTHHVQLVPRTLFDRFAALAQARDFRRKLGVARVECTVDAALRDQLSVKIPHSQPAAFAEPQRPLDRDQQRGENDGQQPHDR